MAEQNEKITIHRDGQSVHLRQGFGGQVRIHISLKFQRRGGRKEIVVPNGLPAFQSERAAYQKPLVIALAQAHLWQRLLDEPHEQIAALH
jgi:hypothetical protein